MNKPIFVAAAIKASNGRIYTGFAHCVIEYPPGIDVEGFVDSTGRFYTREQASLLCDVDNFCSDDLPVMAL